MMKRLFILFTIFLSYASTTLQAQDNLPQNFSISLGGGVTFSVKMATVRDTT